MSFERRRAECCWYQWCTQISTPLYILGRPCWYSLWTTHNLPTLGSFYRQQSPPYCRGSAHVILAQSSPIPDIYQFSDHNPSVRYNRHGIRPQNMIFIKLCSKCPRRGGGGCVLIWIWKSYVEFLCIFHYPRKTRMTPNPFYFIFKMSVLEIYSVTDLVSFAPFYCRIFVWGWCVEFNSK